MILSKFFTGPIGMLTSTFLLACCILGSQAQVASEGTIDLTAFNQPIAGWQALGDVAVPWTNQRAMDGSPGEGLWAHIPKRKNKADDLITTSAYGDIELEFDYLLASGSRATVYLHDAYPMVLADDGSGVSPHVESNGGIPGYAPRQQVSRAPGLWQHLKVAFKAPRFDNAGTKIAPARLLRAELNGIVIHEDIPLQPLPGRAEKSLAPLRIAVANGPIAFRNAKITPLSEKSAQPNWNNPDPIWVQAQVNTTLRSFMDIPGGIRVVHAISVGHPQRVHYTYDLDRGNLAQAWRGGFLDATPMWHERGNGTSRILGSPIYFGKPSLAIAKLTAPEATWPQDTAGTGFRPKGYTMDSNDLPTFRYQLYGTQVNDAIRPLPTGNGFSRTVTITGAPDGLYFQLAAAPSIVDQGGGVYLIGDKAWYVKLEDSGKEKPFIRNSGESKELLVPVHSTLRYSIIF